MRPTSRTVKTEQWIRSSLPSRFQPLLRRAVRCTVEQVPNKIWNQKSQGASQVHVTVAVVGTQNIRRLNQRYRGKDRPTDVLAFPSPKIPGISSLGDVVVCWPIAKKQTKLFGTTPAEEVQRLVVHGVLHLFGYDHETSLRDARRMFSLQNQILKELKKR